MLSLPSPRVKLKLREFVMIVSSLDHLHIRRKERYWHEKGLCKPYAQTPQSLRTGNHDSSASYNISASRLCPFLRKISPSNSLTIGRPVDSAYRRRTILIQQAYNPIPRPCDMHSSLHNPCVRHAHVTCLYAELTGFTIWLQLVT